MARPKEFAHDEAVLKAAALFRRQGYEATSVRHLLDELGISSSSFYAAFGGKDGLFMEALEAHAAAEQDQLRLALVGTRPFREQFAGLLAGLIDELAAAGNSSSLTLTAAIELSGSKPEVLEFLSRYVGRVTDMVAGLIAAAVERGELSPRFPPEHLARFLLFSTFNLGFVAKVSTRRETLEGYAAIALAALDDHDHQPNRLPA